MADGLDSCRQLVAIRLIEEVWGEWRPRRTRGLNECSSSHPTSIVKDARFNRSNTSHEKISNIWCSSSASAAESPKQILRPGSQLRSSQWERTPDVSWSCVGLYFIRILFDIRAGVDYSSVQISILEIMSPCTIICPGNNVSSPNFLLTNLSINI